MRNALFTLVPLVLSCSCGRIEQGIEPAAPAFLVATQDRGTEDPGDWKTILEQDLHLLGHRNWILVVDKAFPYQSSHGMKYIYVDEDLLPVGKLIPVPEAGLCLLGSGKRRFSIFAQGIEQPMMYPTNNHRLANGI